MIQLGQVARDVVSGFEGTVTAKVEYINGCIQFALTPKATDGVMRNSEYFDFQRLEYISEGVAMPSREAGGIMRDQPSTNYRG